MTEEQVVGLSLPPSGTASGSSVDYSRPYACAPEPPLLASLKAYWQHIGFSPPQREVTIIACDGTAVNLGQLARERLARESASRDGGVSEVGAVVAVNPQRTDGRHAAEDVQRSESMCAAKEAAVVEGTNTPTTTASATAARGLSDATSGCGAEWCSEGCRRASYTRGHSVICGANLQPLRSFIACSVPDAVEAAHCYLMLQMFAASAWHLALSGDRLRANDVWAFLMSDPGVAAATATTAASFKGDRSNAGGAAGGESTDSAIRSDVAGRSQHCAALAPLLEAAVRSGAEAAASRGAPPSQLLRAAPAAPPLKAAGSASAHSDANDNPTAGGSAASGSATDVSTAAAAVGEVAPSVQMAAAGEDASNSSPPGAVESEQIGDWTVATGDWARVARAFAITPADVAIKFSQLALNLQTVAPEPLSGP